MSRHENDPCFDDPYWFLVSSIYPKVSSSSWFILSKMKFPKAISLLLLSSVEAHRGSPQEIYTAAEDERDLSALMEITSCFDSHEFEVYFQGKCTFDELASRMDLMLEESGGDCLSTGELEVLSLLGLNATDIEEGRESVKQLCKAAMDEASTDPNMAVQWDEIAGYGGNFDQNFYDGKTFWNEEIETNVDTIVPGLASNRLKTDAERVDDFYETVAERTAFTWPEVSNFENCEINTAYCCWVSPTMSLLLFNELIHFQNANCKPFVF